MFGKGKVNLGAQQSVVAEKENLSKDDVFKMLVEEYASSRMDLIIRLRQKRITDEEFMAYVDVSKLPSDFSIPLLVINTFSPSISLIPLVV